MKQPFILIMLGMALCPIFAAHADDDFGRLFTSEAERRQLDAYRANQGGRSTVEELTTIEIQNSEPSTAPPMEIEFSGYIRRPDGTYAFWVNGKSSLSGTNLPIQGAHFSNKNDSVALSTSQYKVVIKPGQVWSLKDNAIYEGYNSTPGP